MTKTNEARIETCTFCKNRVDLIEVWKPHGQITGKDIDIR